MANKKKKEKIIKYSKNWRRRQNRIEKDEERRKLKERDAVELIENVSTGDTAAQATRASLIKANLSIASHDRVRTQSGINCDAAVLHSESNRSRGTETHVAFDQSFPLSGPVLLCKRTIDYLRSIYPSVESYEPEKDKLVTLTNLSFCDKCGRSVSDSVISFDTQNTDNRLMTYDYSGLNSRVEGSENLKPTDIIGAAALQVYGGYECDGTHEVTSSSDRRTFLNRSETHDSRESAFLNDDDLCVVTGLRLTAITDNDPNEASKDRFQKLNCLDNTESVYSSSVKPFACSKLKASAAVLTESSRETIVADQLAEATADDIALDFEENGDEDLIRVSEEDDDNNVADMGRRITSFPYFFDELGKKLRGHRCPFGALKITSFCNRGLRTKLDFVCRKCDFASSIWTDPENGPLMGLNASLVAGSITSGIGHATAQELLASIGVPGMSPTVYRKYRNVVHDIVETVANEEMDRAAALEAEIAIGKGDVINGIPMVTAVADGAWSKRSPVTGSLDALSGVAAIFGHTTGLALFINCRNKICSVCDRASRQSTPTPEHRCWKNWNREQSSTSMEKDIIVQGFKTSLNRKTKLIYKTLIADGDSSVYNAILAADPYVDHGIIVRKIECSNHLFRNLCKKFRKTSAERIPASILVGLNLKMSTLRMLISSAGLRIRRAVERARDLRIVEDVPEEVKSQNLQQDIFTIFGHILGNHPNCESLLFPCEAEQGEVNLIPHLRKSKIYDDLYKAVSYLASHASSLLRNVTNNVAEGCNSVINKCNASKRTNQCYRNGFQVRSYVGMLQHNTQRALSKIQEGAGKAVPRAVLELEKSRHLHASTTKAHRQRSKAPRRRKFMGRDKDYGNSPAMPDIDEGAYTTKMENILKEMKADQANRDQIERDTVGQSDSDYWLRLRRRMITASKFGAICSLRQSTSCAGIVSSICQGKAVDSLSVQYGVANESKARAALELKLNKKITSCGLFVDKQFEYLGATPDGLIDEDGIVEIKCPFTARETTIQDAVKRFPNLRRMFASESLDSMNTKHQYYYQVQGQLHITGRQYCVFALWTSVDLICITIENDCEFCRTKMQPALSRFYKDCMLPEIVDSRLSRGMKIREPAYRAKAKVELHRRQNLKIGKRKGAVQQSKLAKRRKIVAKIDSIPVVIDKTPIQIRASRISAPRKKSQANNWVVIEDERAAEVEGAVEAIETVRRNISVDEVIADIEPLTNLLNDTSIDFFQDIVKENSDMQNFYPACYTAYATLIKSCNPLERDMQIIGGNANRHWCCLYYDGSTLFIYDSLCRCEYNFLHAEETRYISKRYNHLTVDDIMFMPVTKQPDIYSCGVYSAAFATSIALGGDPTNISYSCDPVKMRKHLVEIIQNRKLMPFPTE